MKTKVNLLLIALLLLPIANLAIAQVEEEEDIRVEDTLPERGKESANSKFYRKLEQADIDYFVDGSRELVSEYRDENGGELDLVAIRPYLERSLHDYKDFSYFTNAEYLTFKSRYDKLIDAAKKQQMNTEQRTAALLDLVKLTVNEVAKNPLEKKGPGTICHSSYECGQGLDCTGVPQRAKDKLAGILNAAQIDINTCLASGSETQDFTQCCSGELKEIYGKTVCAEVRACAPVVASGSSCFDNENCVKGLECVQAQSFNCGVQSFADIMGLTLPEGLKDMGSTCKKNEDCASNSCISGHCQEVFTCLPACVGAQGTLDRGKKCCPGLLEENIGGKPMCVPNCPPMGAFKTTPKSEQNILVSILSALSPIAVANAQDTDANNTNSPLNPFFNIFNRPTPTPTPVPVENQFRNEIKGNRAKYMPGGIQRTIQESESKKLKEALTLSSDQRQNDTIAAVPAFSLKEGSDFETCRIDFRADHYIYLQNKEDQAKKLAKGKLFDIEVALLGYEFVALGNGVQDFWKAGEQGKNMHERLKDVAIARRDFRRAYLEDLKVVDKEVRCLCLDKNGYEKINDTEQQWFREYCPVEYEAHMTLKAELAAREVQSNDHDGDASGVKYKRMLVAWTAANKKFADILYSGNNVHLANLNDLSNWSRSNNWYEVETKQYDVFSFTVKNPGAVASGILVGAMLAAAVVAVVSGMAMGPTISLWAAIGIVSASGVAGGAGMWLVGALKGAWVAQGPEVYDDHIRGPYKCGKKDQCSDYKRILYQPYNNVCKTHTGANACVKSFLVYAPTGADDQQILVDPFVPLNVETNDLIKDKRVYASLMDQGFHNALSVMRSKRPGGQQNTSYFDTTFIDARVVGHYTPPIDKSYEQTYVLNMGQIDKIKKAARDYAAAEGFFDSGSDNLTKFGDYVFKYHFVWPKVSLKDRIAYPLPGFQTYLEMVTTMLDTITIDNGANIAGYSDLNQNYVNDYLHTIQNIGSASRLSQLNGTEIDTDQAKTSVAEEVAQIGNSFTKSSGLLQNSARTGLNSSGSILGKTGGAGNPSDAASSGLLSQTSDVVKRAIATNNQAREDRSKRLEDFKKKNAGNKKAEALAGFQDQMMAAMTSPLGGATPASFGSLGLGASGLDSGLLNNSSGSNKNALADKDKAAGEDSANSIDWGNNFQGGAPSTGFGGVDYGAQYGSSDATRGSGLSGNADNKRLFEAVDARDKNSKNYEGSERDSLFEKITKAYIRNYDRVLPRIQK